MSFINKLQLIRFGQILPLFIYLFASFASNHYFLWLGSYLHMNLKQKKKSHQVCAIVHRFLKFKVKYRISNCCISTYVF